ncbi:MAG: sigma 54-interacting transcriptional regulator [Thermoanaerobaculia bacterium]
MLRITVRYANQALFFSPPAAGAAATATLGSAEENDFVVPFPGISRQHASITHRPGGLLLSDLGSKNGLLRGDQRFAELLLAPGETVQIGRAEVGLEEISSSDGEIAFALPRSLPSLARPAVLAHPSSDTDPLFETAGHATPGSALALVRRIETSSQLELGTATTRELLARARQTLGADSLLVLATERLEAGLEIQEIDGPLPAAVLLDPLQSAVVSSPGDGLPLVALPDGRLALVRQLQVQPRRLLLAALLPPESGKPAGWKLDFFDYLAEKLMPSHRRPTPMDRAPKHATAHPERTHAGESDPLRLPPEFVHGGSVAIDKLLHHLRATVKSTMDVLILGETGTGKEMIAHLVHASGPSAKGPFVAINCAAIPAELLEADLFGVEARVATGVDPRPGLFAKAEGGSLFLDEIGDMPERLQAKLLRVLQEREILPVGAHQPKKIKVRVISASNQDLAERVQAGTFRADLYYRLRGLQFHLPPLRERKEDLPALVLAFATETAKRYNKEIHGVSRKALDLLTAYPWPGNIRELKNEVDRAVLLATDGGCLESEHFGTIQYAVTHAIGASQPNGPLPTEFVPALNPSIEPATPAALDLHSQIDAVERRAILQALATFNGNKSKAARELGITRNGLALKMKRLVV